MLFETGNLERAAAVLAESTEVAAAAGLPALRARIRVKLAEIHNQNDSVPSAAIMSSSCSAGCVTEQLPSGLRAPGR
jgi:hypothetical protein